MKRREFLKTSAAGMAGMAFSRNLFAAGKHGKKPNILLIMSDEHNPRITGCYGNKLVRTPNMDALAAEGTTFERHYCNSPLCSPSRASFTAGKYISRVSAWNNRCELPGSDIPSLPRRMSAAGYDSYLCGKMHYDRTRRYGFTQIGGNFNDNFKDGRGDPRTPPDHIHDNSTAHRFFTEFHPGDDGVSVVHDRKVTAGALEFLSKRKASDKPFFLLVGYISPHFPLIVPEEYWKRYEGKVEMPVIPKGFLDSLPTNYKVERSEFKERAVPAPIVRRGRELYYGLTDWLDGEIGKVLTTLRANKELAENTVIIYTSDHGENMGDHGMWWKSCMWEEAARVPMIISWPQRWHGGQRRSLASSHVDLIKTIIEIGGGHAPHDWDGDSMVRWIEDERHPWKDLAVSEYYAHNISSGFVMLRTGDWKYVYHTTIDKTHPAERQLFNISTDPQEFRNLAYKPEHAQRIAELHSQLVKELGTDPELREQQARRELAVGYHRTDQTPEVKCAGPECRTLGSINVA